MLRLSGNAKMAAIQLAPAKNANLIFLNYQVFMTRKVFMKTAQVLNARTELDNLHFARKI